MAPLDEIATRKLLQMKALLGDEASKKIIAEAEAKEQSAQNAGVDFKEKTTEKAEASAEDEQTEDNGDPLTLSELLAELEQGLESGAIVDDVTAGAEGEEQVYAGDAEAKEADEAFKATLKEIFSEVASEVFKNEFAGFLTALSIKESQADPKVAALNTKMKETEAVLAKQKEQLDVLLGVQPKSKPFRASQSADTKVTQKDAAALDEPHADPVNSFINDFVLGSNGKA